ncbi:MAG TPA: molybdopterin dehydrogenase, partial [Sediminispirochaeta sp.]|nr:molybdopterin dehydrogenase [Sediminispirochaeta sp.]
ADSWRVAVGARPGRARLSESAAEILGSSDSVDEGLADRAGSAASEELKFGADLRGDAEYRREICRVLVKRALMEVTK